jgi:hypothetical protein
MYKVLVGNPESVMKRCSGFRKKVGMNPEKVQRDDLDWIYATQFNEQWQDL